MGADIFKQALDPEGYKKANDPQTSGKIKIAYGE